MGTWVVLEELPGEPCKRVGEGDRKEEEGQQAGCRAGGALAASTILRLHFCYTVILQNTDAPTTKMQVTLTSVTSVRGAAVTRWWPLATGTGSK